MRFQQGDAVGPYRVTGFIGEGASGVVYQVVNSVTGRLEAIKILSDSYGNDLDQAQRFLREIQLQAKLDHPNIAQVRTAFCEGQTIVLVMELVDGEPLSAILQRGPLLATAAIQICEQVLNALIMAHHHGVIHRDVKPANILLDRYGVAKLTDFGLAKQCGEPGQTAHGIAVGTVFYMAPEQVRGLAATDWRADLYAVGIVFYEMLTGRRPFNGPDQYAIMRAQIELKADPVSRWATQLPKEFDALIERALQKDPAQRFQSASGFLAALQELPVTPPNPPRVPWQYATYAAGLGSLLLAAFAVPPRFWNPPVETLQIAMPSTPAVPADALHFSTPPLEPPPAQPVPVPLPRTVPPAPVRRPAPFTARRINNIEPARTIEPPPVKANPLVAASPAALPPPPKVSITELAPTPGLPAVEPEFPTEKPSNWMRRGLGKVPKLFRRREPQTSEKKQ